MEERQIWELLSSNMIGLSIFLFGNAFLIWVAFRVSKSVNETGGNIPVSYTHLTLPTS